MGDRRAESVLAGGGGTVPARGVLSGDGERGLGAAGAAGAGQGAGGGGQTQPHGWVTQEGSDARVSVAGRVHRGGGSGHQADGERGDEHAGDRGGGAQGAAQRADADHELEPVHAGVRRVRGQRVPGARGVRVLSERGDALLRGQRGPGGGGGGDQRAGGGELVHRGRQRAGHAHGAQGAGGSGRGGGGVYAGADEPGDPGGVAEPLREAEGPVCAAGQPGGDRARGGGPAE